MDDERGDATEKVEMTEVKRERGVRDGMMLTD